MSVHNDLLGFRSTPATATEVLSDVIATPWPRTVQELTRPGRSESTVARAVAQLKAAGLLQQADREEIPMQARPSRGRPVIPVKINHKLAIVGIVVVDVDNEPAKLVGTVTDLSGRPADHGTVTVVLSSQQRSTSRELALSIIALAEEMIENIEDRLVIGVGVCLGGHIRDGEVQRFPGGHWARFDLQGFLHDRLGRPVRVDNDTTAFALRLALHGATAQSSLAVVCVFDEGIGGGLVLDGRVWRGSRGLPMEPGHVAVESSLPPVQNEAGEDVFTVPKCRCGSSGCVEAYAAPTQMLQRLREFDPQAHLTLRQASDQPADRTAVATVFRLAGHAIGRGVANIINIVDPAQVRVYAPPALAQAARGSAGAEWHTELFRAVELNDFAHGLSAKKDETNRRLQIEPMTLQELEDTCAQAACCLITESLLAQLDGMSTDFTARIDLDAFQHAAVSPPAA